jgi:PAS domain S-box-containing protein
MSTDPQAGALPDSRQLIAHLPIAVYVCEAPSGVIKMYNRRAAELWGREPQLGDTAERFCGAFRLFSPDGSFLPHAETPMADVLRHGGHRDQDVVIERPDGTRVTVRVSIAALHDAHGRIVGAVNAFQDITERKLAEEAAAYLGAIVSSADDAIISKTLDGFITSWNAGAERIFGYPDVEAIGKKITLIIPPERLEEEELILSRLKRGERIEHFETERVAKDGRRIPISLTVSPVKASDGRIIGASKVARDIGERKRFESERDELLRRESSARVQAQRANQAKDEFLAMLAHELRNPVGVIVNALAVLDEARDVHQEHARARRVIRRQAEHLGMLLDDLLDVARITGGHIALEREAVDLGVAIEQAVETERHRVEGKRQHVALSLGGEPVTVVGDPVRLHQIFGNLLNNAWKYTPPGGSIGITLGVEGDEAIVKIKDSGVGIPADKLESIFELFTQANPTLARTEGGLGIGLTLVKQLVELHGGTVEARSEGPGRGAELLVRLPLARATLAPSPPPSVSTQLVSRRVLVIEDNSDGRDMLVTVLRLAGHEVHAAGTGAEGVQLALQHSPAVVLLDIGLPDLNGYEVGRELRQRLGPSVRLVALTGYGQPQDRARTEEAGFDAHVVKPVDPATLTSLLQRLP